MRPDMREPVRHGVARPFGIGDQFGDEAFKKFRRSAIQLST